MATNWLEDAKQEFEESVAGNSQEIGSETDDDGDEQLDDNYGLEEGESPSKLSATEKDTSSADDLDSDVVSASTQDTPDIEEVYVSDANGRRKIKVDYTNREKVKKAYQMAAGMRKFQAERDRYKSQFEKIEPEYKDLKDSWNALEQAFDSEGIRGVVNLLAGKEGAYDEWAESLYQTRRAKEDANPQELAQIELQEKLAQQEKEAKRLAKLIDERDQKTRQATEEAERKQLEAALVPAFNKYRFSGKLGDEVLEQTIDSAIWAQTISSLEQLEDSIELTPAVIEKEFRRIALTFNRAINKESDKKATKAIASKKKNVQEAIQKKAIGNMRTNNAVEQFNDDLSKGNLTGALKSWFAGNVRAK